MKLPDLTRRNFVRSVSALGVTWLVWTAPRTGISQSANGGAWSNASASASTGRTELHKLDAVSIKHVVIDDEFWAPKRKVWKEVTLRDCLTKFETDRGGAINNFDKVRAGQTGLQ